MLEMANDLADTVHGSIIFADKNKIDVQLKISYPASEFRRISCERYEKLY